MKCLITRFISLLFISNVVVAMQQREKLLIHYAAQSGDPQALRVALDERREKVDAVNEDGMRPLHVAVIHSHFPIQSNFPIIEKLLKRGALINQPDSSAFGYTPLHIAVEKRNLPALKFLIQHGARSDIPDGQGKTVLQRMQELGWEDALQYLDASRNQPKPSTSKSGLSFDDIEQDLDQGKSPMHNKIPKVNRQGDQEQRVPALNEGVVRELKRIAAEKTLEIETFLQEFAPLMPNYDPQVIRQDLRAGAVDMAAARPYDELNLEVVEQFRTYCDSMVSYNEKDYKDACEGKKGLAFTCLKGADLRGKNLDNVNFFGADLRGAIFNEATSLNNTKLFYADLSGAKITGCHINNMTMFGVNLSGCQFRQVAFDHLTLHQARTGQTQLQNVTIKNSTIFDINRNYIKKKCELLSIGNGDVWEHVQFEGCCLRGIYISKGTFNEVSFLRSRLMLVELMESRSSEIAFVKCFLEGYVNAKSSTLDNITFDTSLLIKADFSESTINKLDIFNPPPLSLTDGMAYYYCSVNFADSTLTNCSFVGIAAHNDNNIMSNLYPDYTIWGTGAHVFGLGKIFLSTQSYMEYALEHNPFCQFECNLRMAKFDKCFFNFICLKEQCADAFEIRGFENGCIFNNVLFEAHGGGFSSARINGRRFVKIFKEKKAIVNGEIDPRWAGFYASPAVQDGLVQFASKAFIQAAAAKAGAVVVGGAASSCSVQ